MKKSILIIVVAACSLVGISMAAPPTVPSFETDFANHLTNPKDNSENTTEKVYDLQINPDASLAENLKRLFYPSVSGNG